MTCRRSGSSLLSYFQAAPHTSGQPDRYETEPAAKDGKRAIVSRQPTGPL